MTQPKEFERWNTHFSTSVEQELFGLTFHLRQDPNSNHLGTTVWDASIVLAKYFEKNARKGDFARSKVVGKRCVELGAGMGFGGLAFAMLGCDVVLTDVGEVLPLLQANYDNNLSPAALRARDATEWLTSVGKISVQELDWNKPEHYQALLGQVDYVIAADCVYHEMIIEELLKTVLAILSPKGTVIVANELRSESVHSRFLQIFGQQFTIKKVPHVKMDATHQHTLIDILIMKRKKAETGKA